MIINHKGTKMEKLTWIINRDPEEISSDFSRIIRKCAVAPLIDVNNY